MRGSILRANIRIAVVISAAMLLVGCATVPITGRSQLSLVPHMQLVSLSSDAYKRLLDEEKLSDDTEKTRMVVEVGKRIAAAAEDFMRENGMEAYLKDYQWEYKLIEDDERVNAFCMPGGKIGVYTGILPIAKDEEGLAVLLGHEVAHAIANHGGERLSQLLLVNIGGVTLSRAIDRDKKKTRRLALAAYGLGTYVGFILPYSRFHEWEADRIGLILMARAGYDPRVAIPFWERMISQDRARLPEFLSTHPAPAGRIEAIREAIPEALTYYKTDR